MQLSRNENFQLFSTFFASQARHEMGSPSVAPAFAVRGQVFSPLPENGSGKRWKEVEREHKKSGNRWNGFHLLPPLSICFHEFPPQNLFEEKLYFKGGATVAAPGSRSLSQHIAAYRNVFFSQPSTFSHQPAGFPAASSLFQRNPAYSNVFIFAERSGAVLDFAKRTHT